MKDLGHERPLYILPFDHRGTFQINLFGWKGSLTPEQAAPIAASKQVIYDGFEAAIAAGAAEGRHLGGRAVWRREGPPSPRLPHAFSEFVGIFEKSAN